MAYEEINAPKKLLINDGNQQEIFESLEFHKELVRWYDYWLKGEDTGIMDEPPVKIYVKGKEEFRYENEWPLSRAVYTEYYLHEGPMGVVDSINDGGLSKTPPEADEKPDVFSYPHPEWFGWPGLGTGVLYKGIPNPVRGVLTYITEPMKDDVEVTGPIVLILYASSDQSDTDFCVRLSDQEPDPFFIKRFIMKKMGLAPKAEILTRGWLKASHRKLDKERSKTYRPFHTHTNVEELEPGKIYKFEIEIWPISNVFKKGHRIRIDLAPGDSTVFDAPFWHYYGVKMGADTIYHDAEHPSHLLLPIISKE
jgi:putative CocE/NonD family hydrolase